jgi:predicted transcriptional regulator of viral defense system
LPSRLEAVASPVSYCVHYANSVEHSAHAILPARPDLDSLFAVAEPQAGYFTAAQAGRVGYSRGLLAHHAKAGTFERVRPGVYRIRRFPASPREDLYIAWLEAGPRAVVSHDSALELYGLSDLLPAETHLTLPRTSSRRRQGIRMHTTNLDVGEITVRDGLPVTTVARTIADVARSGAAAELVAQAVHEALDRGLVGEAELREQASRRGGRAKRAILAVLKPSQGEFG